MILSFTDKLIKLAFGWIECKEDPKTPNRSACLNVLHKMYGGEPTSEPWCAIFVWTMTNEACKIFNVENKLPKTKSTIQMRDRAKNSGLKVDKIPAVGSVFFYPRTGGGHVGIVIEVRGGEIITIEGNVSDAVRFGKRKLSDHKFEFIHTENMTNKKLVLGKALNKYMIYIPTLLGAYVGARRLLK